MAHSKRVYAAHQIRQWSTQSGCGCIRTIPRSTANVRIYYVFNASTHIAHYRVLKSSKCPRFNNSQADGRIENIYGAQIQSKSHIQLAAASRIRICIVRVRDIIPHMPPYNMRIDSIGDSFYL